MNDLCRYGHPILADGYCAAGHVRPVQKMNDDLDKFAAEATKLIRERYKISEAAAVMGSLESIVRFALEKAYALGMNFVLNERGK